MRKWFLIVGLIVACVAAPVRAGRAADALPAPIYFPVLPFDAAPDAAPQMVPVAMSRFVDGIQHNVKRAVIVVHDESRDPNSAMAYITTLAGAAGPSTMVIAPQFLIPSDLILIAKYLPLPSRAFAVWGADGWPNGGESATNAASKGISSFTILDTLVMYLANRYLFPKLETVIVVGYGTSANFVHRYAELGIAPSTVADADLDVRFVIAGASSYLYPTGNRPLGTNKGFGRPDVAACPDFNAYPYGLEKLNNYGKRVGANAIKVTFPSRFVTYVASSRGDLVGDNSCAAQVQGANGAERLRNFRTYLSSLYDPIVMQRHVFSVVDDGRADPLSLLGSPCGMATLFGDGICEGVKQ